MYQFPSQNRHMKIRPILGINKFVAKDGLLPIYIRVNIGEKRTLVPVDIKIKKYQWDVKSGRVKPEHPNAQEINFKIIDLLNSIEKNYIKDEVVHSGDIENFYWWFDERLNYTKKTLSGYHYKKMYVIKKKLEAFAPRLPFKNIDNLFLMKYEQHLSGLGNAPNTIADNLMRIRTIVNMIRKKFREWPSPFDGYVFKTTKVKKVRTSFDNIMKLYALPLDRYKQKELAVHMYVYSFFNAGIRWGDLCRIKVLNIQEGRLRYTMHKTKIERNIKQQSIPIEIIKSHSKGKKPDDYLFDVGVKWRKNDDKDQIDLEEQSINDRGTLLNAYLKAVCVSIDLPPITFHTARHSFADYTKQKKFGGKFDFHTLKDLLGHKQARTTEIYLESIYEEESDLAMDQLFGSENKLPKSPKKSSDKKGKSK